MTKKSIIILVIMVVLIGGAMVWAKSGINSEPVNDDAANQGADKAFPPPADTSVKTETKTPLTNTVPAQGSYEAYGPEKIAKSANGKVVLFFHAPWCPTCIQLDTDIKSHLDNIPDRVTILKTDYDTEVALKQKYGVTYQHTLVQVDAKGNLITKWAGSPTLSALLGNIK